MKNNNVNENTGELYRLRYLSFYGKKRGILAKSCFNLDFECFVAPTGMKRKDILKVLSYLLDSVYKNSDGKYERDSLYSATRLSILLCDENLGVKELGFKEIKNIDNKEIIDLYIVSGNSNKIKKNRKYKNYFDWYIPNITKEDFQSIYKNYGLECPASIVGYNVNKEYEDEEVCAVTCNRSFVVAPDKAEAFKNVQPNLELRKENERLLSKLNITDLTNNNNVESEKVYVKKFKK